MNFSCGGDLVNLVSSILINICPDAHPFHSSISFTMMKDKSFITVIPDLVISADTDRFLTKILYKTCILSFSYTYVSIFIFDGWRQKQNCVYLGSGQNLCCNLCYDSVCIGNRSQIHLYWALINIGLLKQTDNLFHQISALLWFKKLPFRQNKSRKFQNHPPILWSTPSLFNTTYLFFERKIGSFVIIRNLEITW